MVGPPGGHDERGDADEHAAGSAGWWSSTRPPRDPGPTATRPRGAGRATGASRVCADLTRCRRLLSTTVPATAAPSSAITTSTSGSGTEPEPVAGRRRSVDVGVGRGVDRASCEASVRGRRGSSLAVRVGGRRGLVARRRRVVRGLVAAAAVVGRRRRRVGRGRAPGSRGAGRGRRRPRRLRPAARGRALGGGPGLVGLSSGVFVGLLVGLLVGVVPLVGDGLDGLGLGRARRRRATATCLRRRAAPRPEARSRRPARRSPPTRPPATVSELAPDEEYVHDPDVPLDQ